jgi:hypothetical protein
MNDKIWMIRSEMDLFISLHIYTYNYTKTKAKGPATKIGK